jgi:hypothetical protein
MPGRLAGWLAVPAFIQQLAPLRRGSFSEAVLSHRSDNCHMARDTYSLGDIAARRATMLDIRCGRCDRHGRLSVARLLAEHGPNAEFSTIMRGLVGDCPHRDEQQIQNRCDPYCPDLVRLFYKPGLG